MTQDNSGYKAKNIILCSDGTGNKGGVGAETNVFQLYNAIDIHDPQQEQVVFYENGVGTQKNKIIKGLTGAFGIGFGQNVRDLYEFLVRQYVPGDTIYMFGFSRGAATIRGFAGMLQICGLVDKYIKDARGDYQLDDKGHKIFKCDEQLSLEMTEAFNCYVKNDPETQQAPQQAIQFKANKALHDDKFVPDGNLPIKFIGVWDTVSALGFPDGLNKFAASIVMGIQRVINLKWPHLFYNYQLNDNVEHAFHALALDDERRTFYPKVWREIPKSDEPLERPTNIEQVWFAGVHSNVGGGYTRKGLSNVTFDWMLERAQLHGLKFITGFCQNIKERANVHGRLYDSRDGLAFYYRYSPRNMNQLCIDSGKIPSGQIKIHDSVFSRMKYRTSEFAPAELPRTFQVVSSSVDDLNTGHSKAKENEPMSQEIFTEHKTAIHSWVDVRQGVYRILARLTLFYVLLALWLWQYPVQADPGTTGGMYSFLVHIKQIVDYFVPEIFEDFVSYFILVNPIFGGVSVTVAGLLLWYKKKSKKNHAILSRAFRDDVLVNEPKVVHNEKQRISKHSFAKLFTLVANVITVSIVLLLLANLGVFGNLS